MIKGTVKKKLNKKNILQRVSSYDIYRYYIGRDFDLRESIPSPFRRDRTPSFNVIPTKSGSLHHMDFGDSEKRGDCFLFVSQLFSLTSWEALKKIDNDFGLGLWKGEEIEGHRIISFGEPKERKPVIIQVSSRRFDLSELKYWGEYHIGEERLKKNDVYAIKALYINKKKVPLNNDLVFGYLFEDKWKIYWPHREKHEKWISNVPNSVMSGLNKITNNCNTAFIVKSKKDEMVCEQIIPETCSVQSESTVSISEENIKFFQKSCKKVIVGFDPDTAGVAACTYYNQFGFGYVNIPKDIFLGLGCKDFADYAKRFGMRDLELFFKSKNVI